MHFQSPVVTSLGRTASFALALASAALLGVVWQGGFSPVSLHPPYGAVGIFPLGLFCFTGCIPNILAFKWNLEKSAPILRVPPSVFDAPHIPEEAPMFPAIFLLFFWRRSEVFFCWLLSHVWSGFLLEDSVLEGPLDSFLILPAFSEESPKWSAIFSQSLPRKMACFVPSDILGSLRSCRQV